MVAPPDGSAAQELARTAPGARVVKAFTTTFAGDLNPIDAGRSSVPESSRPWLLHMTLQGSLGTGFSTAVKILA